MVRLSCSVSLGTIFYRSPKRNCRGVSMGVDLGLAFCPGAMGLDTSGHRAPGRRIGLGSSPWFPGVSLPSCAKPNKLLNNHECWVLFLKGHEFVFHRQNNCRENDRLLHDITCGLLQQLPLCCEWQNNISVTAPWASYQIRKIAGCACAGNAGKRFLHHCGLVIPTCIMARASSTCRDACRYR